ncbi:SDR family oxidoreductase [Pseudanabaena sp. PCC 6802]|uniref:SDR family oxidoreductase n=1 Tax=Pseudanabaena sp. PCC 6802 TaxID=118173 RepID=UPI000344E430|nr:SDR family oxidoreductase [Pseudanabaena sp. PCC 6802]
MTSQLAGQKILITGASSGIGKATASALVKLGASVALVSRNPDRAIADISAQKTASASVKAYELDLSDVSSVAAKIENIVADFGGVDTLVNNAGMAYIGELIDTPLADWQKVIDLNLTSVFQCIQAVLPAMRRQQHGTIVNVASIAAKQAFPQWGAYCASKFGLLGMAQALAEEERSHGIKVMSICPGSVNTPLWDTVAANFDREAMLTEDNVADAIVYLLSLPANAVVSDLVLMPNAGVL